MYSVIKSIDLGREITHTCTVSKLSFGVARSITELKVIVKLHVLAFLHKNLFPILINNLMFFSYRKKQKNYLVKNPEKVYSLWLIKMTKY